MNIIDAINQVDKSTPHDVDFEDLCQELGISWQEIPNDFYDRVKCYYLVKWICTDTWVGMTIVYFDDKPIATTWQMARKCDTTWKFLSQEAADNLYKYIVSSRVKTWPIIDNDEDIGDFYTVNYGSQLLVKKGLYNGKPVTVFTTYENHKDYKFWSIIVVKDEEGVEHTINLKDFHIPFHLAKEA